MVSRASTMNDSSCFFGFSVRCVPRAGRSVRVDDVDADCPIMTMSVDRNQLSDDDEWRSPIKYRNIFGLSHELREKNRCESHGPIASSLKRLRCEVYLYVHCSHVDNRVTRVVAICIDQDKVVATTSIIATIVLQKSPFRGLIHTALLSQSCPPSARAYCPTR